MGEFRLPSGVWGDIFPDFKMQNLEDSFIISPVGINPDTKNLIPVFQINHTGNITMLYSTLVNNTITVNGTGNSYINENLGINMKIPLFPLHVNGTIRATNFIGDGSKLTGISGISGGTDEIWLDNDNDIYYINGNVGIGTTNPRVLLDVNGSIRANYDLDTTSYFGRSAIGAINNFNYNSSVFSHLDHNTESNYALLQESNGITSINTVGDNLTFTVLGNEKMLIQNNNTVIDTNMQINGTLTVKGEFIKIISDNLNIHEPLIQLSQNTTGTPYYDSGIIIERGDEHNVGCIWDESENQFALINTSIVDIKGNVSIDGYVGIHCANIIANSTNSISSFNGFLGINTTTPQYSLDVNGSINSNGLFKKGGITVGGGVNTTNFYLSDIKPVGTGGGLFYAGSWHTRDLNTIEVRDPNDLSVTILSNQIIMDAGKYYISAKLPAYHAEYHQGRLHNITDDITLAYGTSEYTYTDIFSYSYIEYYIELTSTKTIEIQHRCTLNNVTAGYGVAQSIAATPEIYTTANIIKIYV
jgi:hypothetical protein